MGQDKKNGWIKLDRVFFEHSLWGESREFSRAEAWIDLIQLARYSEKPDVTQIKDRHITCNRGQLIHSLKTLSRRWGWSRSKVKRVLDVFVSRDMIRYRNETVTSCITICNYDAYQPLKSSSETQIERKRNASETQADTQEEGKERKKEKAKVDDSSFFSYGVDIRTISPITREGKKRTRKQLEQLAKLESEGITDY
jgi:hypothetical protein